MTTSEPRDEMSPHPPDPRHPSHLERGEKTDGLLAVSRASGDTTSERGRRVGAGALDLAHDEPR